jgi:hypothetical protein
MSITIPSRTARTLSFLRYYSYDLLKVMQVKGLIVKTYLS